MSGTSLLAFSAERLTIEKISLNDWNEIIAIYSERLNDVKAQIFIDTIGDGEYVKVKLYILTANSSEVLMDKILAALRKLGVEFIFSPNAKYNVPLGELLPRMHYDSGLSSAESTNITPIASNNQDSDSEAN